jgi:hypothetical protein
MSKAPEMRLVERANVSLVAAIETLVALHGVPHTCDVLRAHLQHLAALEAASESSSDGQHQAG